MPMRPYRPVAAMLVTVQLVGCVTWRPVTAGPREYVQEEEPVAIRVTQTDGTELTVRSPVVRGDSIVGDTNASGPAKTPRTASSRPARAPVQPVAVAIADIQRIEVSEAPNSVGIGAAVLLGTAVAMLLLLRNANFGLGN